MLAQNFKTAADLYISEHSLRALITVLGMLERGEMRHVPRLDFGVNAKEGFAGLFNMDVWGAPSHCGTVACIGGTCELIGNFRFTDPERMRLGPLFYPGDGVFDWQKITPEQAATALRNFLTTGEPNWAAAVA